jgi:hypothetical protein
MAIQEFDQPLTRQQVRWEWVFYLSVALLIAVISFTIFSLPGPANERPLVDRQVSEMPVR